MVSHAHGVRHGVLPREPKTRCRKWGEASEACNVFDSTTVENMPPLVGLAVTYHVRYGDMRIETDYQWAGRPASGGKGF